MSGFCPPWSLRTHPHSPTATLPVSLPSVFPDLMRKFAMLKWCQSHWGSELHFTKEVVEVMFLFCLTICRDSIKDTL